MVVNLKTALLRSKLYEQNRTKKNGSEHTVPEHKISPKEEWIRTNKNNADEIIEEINRKNPDYFDEE